VSAIYPITRGEQYSSWRLGSVVSALHPITSGEMQLSSFFSQHKEMKGEHVHFFINNISLLHHVKNIYEPHIHFSRFCSALELYTLLLQGDGARIQPSATKILKEQKKYRQ
jgi:hypothetical protein